MSRYVVLLLLTISISMNLPAAWAQSGKADQLRVSIAEYKSKNFVVRTDLPAWQAQQLLGRLEAMLKLMSEYWGQPSTKIISMYVVVDLKNWPDGLLSANGRASVAGQTGMTETMLQRSAVGWRSESIVYALADRGNPQHEAVHAYCMQTFGSCGPTWYSEGMAEIGQYWQQPHDRSVRCHPIVVGYLNRTQPKRLVDMVDRTELSGDHWQNYAWRWSLCHLLGFNDNYKERFKPLGLALMSQRPGVTFWSVYGTMAHEIEFEHRLFAKNLGLGYRVDLCSWDWKTKFSRVRKNRTIVANVLARRGWQATRLLTESGRSYAYQTTGQWATQPRESAFDADGNTDQGGQLIGVLMTDFELSEPFVLGKSGTFKAANTGKLYVRCQDDWSSLADNSGCIKLKLSLAK